MLEGRKKSRISGILDAEFDLWTLYSRMTYLLISAVIDILSMLLTQFECLTVERK